MLQNYFNIHRKILKKKIESGKCGLNIRKLIIKLSKMHRIHSNLFLDTNYMFELKLILRKYYPDSSFPKTESAQNIQNQINTTTINIDELIEPKKVLMNSNISTIQGDFSVKSRRNPNKKYIFFLLTPFRIVYIWKKN